MPSKVSRYFSPTLRIVASCAVAFLVSQPAVAYANSDASSNCTSEGDRIKALACFSDGGCLNDSEKVLVENAIQNGKGWGSAKSAKVACLRN